MPSCDAYCASSPLPADDCLPWLVGDTNEIDTCIVESFLAALHVVKACNTEEQRREYGILLRAAAPPLLKKGDARGMVAKVAARLRVPRGRRWAKGNKTVQMY